MATTTLTSGQIHAEATLTANTVDTVNFAVFTPYMEVVHDGTAALSITFDGSTPTVGGANTYILPAAVGSRTYRLGPSLGSNPVVKLKSAGTPLYWVTAVATP